MNLKIFTSKFVRTGPSSYKKIICRAAVSQRLRNTGLDGSIPGMSNAFVSSPKSPHRLWGSPGSLCSGFRWFFPQEKAARA